jgi:hypothetical protein
MHRYGSSEQFIIYKFEILADLSFFLTLKYNKFSDFFTLVDIIIIYIKIFFQNSFRISSAIFDFFKKDGLYGARAPFENSPCASPLLSYRLIYKQNLPLETELQLSISIFRHPRDPGSERNFSLYLLQYTVFGLVLTQSHNSLSPQHCPESKNDKSAWSSSSIYPCPEAQAISLASFVSRRPVHLLARLLFLYPYSIFDYKITKRWSNL